VREREEEGASVSSKRDCQIVFLSPFISIALFGGIHLFIFKGNKKLQSWKYFIPSLNFFF